MGSLKIFIHLLILLALFLVSCETSQTKYQSYDFAVYKHQSPAFSVKYPADWAKTRKPYLKTVFFVTASGGFPTLGVGVHNRPWELELEDTPSFGLKVVNRYYPLSSDHKIIKQELITLKDGTRAMAYLFKWQFQGQLRTINLTSTFVVAFKEDKMINVFSTVKDGMSTDLSEQMTRSLQFENEKIVQPKILKTSMRVAVMDFKANGISQLLASNVTELIRNELIMMGSFIVLERSQLDQILNEQGFQMTGCTEISCAVKVGQLVSANKILIGTIMKMGNKIVITGRVVDVSKGIGERAASQTASTIDELDKAAKNFSKML